MQLCQQKPFSLYRILKVSVAWPQFINLTANPLLSIICLHQGSEAFFFFSCFKSCSLCFCGTLIPSSFGCFCCADVRLRREHPLYPFTLMKTNRWFKSFLSSTWPKEQSREALAGSQDLPPAFFLGWGLIRHMINTENDSGTQRRAKTKWADNTHFRQLKLRLQWVL